MSDNGLRIAVSARNANPSTDRVEAGIVRLYSQNSTGHWTQIGKDLEGEFKDEQFGKRIAINEDSTRVAVSTVRWNEKRGRVRTFDYEMGAWIERIKPLEGNEPLGWLGSALSMTPDGELMAVGSDGSDSGGEDSGYVGVYKLDGDTWSLHGNSISGPEAKVRLGINRVHLSDDGLCLAAGGPHYRNETGIGYLFQWKNQTWHKVAEVVGGEPGDRLGTSCALSGDRKWVAWGGNQLKSEGPGYVKVYAVSDLIDSTW